MLKPSQIRLMTFNLRYANPEDGPFSWHNRQDAAVLAMESFEPDLIGLQEVLSEQRNHLRLSMPEYQIVAAGRDDGLDAGEMCAILYRKERFKFIDCGHYWLSPTPDIPGSVGWDAALTRMASWVKLHDLQNPITSEIFFLNAHLDHDGQLARIESCSLIHQMARKLAGDAAVLITGDFNCTEDDPAYAQLVGEDYQDIYRTLHPTRRTDEATFHAFVPDNIHGSRIDWILADQNFKPVQAYIDRELYDGMIPSDHFPAKAIVE